MRRGAGTALLGEQRAVQRLAPAQVLHVALLELPLQELDARLESEVAENPALELIEGPVCPMCRRPLGGRVCAACGPLPARLASAERYAQSDWAGGDGRSVDLDETPWSERVPDACDFRQALLEEGRLLCPDEDLPFLTALVNHLDPDGYLRESLVEIAFAHHRAVPDAERVLRLLQTLDTPGVGARDLQECLRLQAERLCDAHPAAPLLVRILTDGWDLLCARKTEALAKRLKADAAAVGDALRLLRKRLHPSPCAALPDPASPWNPAARAQPDVFFYIEERRIEVDVPDPASARLRIDGEYGRLSRYFESNGRGASPEAAHVREAVSRARMLLEGLTRRRRTLLRIAERLATEQEGFLRRGPLHLKPLTRRQMAEALEMHESTVSRAVAGKWAQLPSGESVPLDRFFQAADSPKEMLRDLIAAENPASPLSDSDLMRVMEAQGHVLARRTVAKYREALGIPSVDLRRRAN